MLMPIILFLNLWDLGPANLIAASIIRSSNAIGEQYWSFILSRRPICINHFPSVQYVGNPTAQLLAFGKRAARFDPGYYSYVGNNGIYEEYTLERTWKYHAQLSTLDGIHGHLPQRGRMLISALPGRLNVLSPQTCSSSSLCSLLIPIHIGVIMHSRRDQATAWYVTPHLFTVALF